MILRVIRWTVYRENGKVKHSTHGRITGLTLEQLKLLQAALNDRSEENDGRNKVERFPLNLMCLFGGH